MKEKVILVESRGDRTRGIVADKREVRIPTSDEVEVKIRDGMRKIADITQEKVNDPAQAVMKHCSRCMALGRVFLHPITEFSIKRDGKPHSQCKTCRSEQACEWQKKKTKERAEYQRKYQAGYRSNRPASKAAMALVKAMDESDRVEKSKDGMNAMFVAVVKDETEEAAS